MSPLTSREKFIISAFSAALMLVLVLAKQVGDSRPRVTPIATSRAPARAGNASEAAPPLRWPAHIEDIRESDYSGIDRRGLFGARVTQTRSQRAAPPILRPLAVAVPVRPAASSAPATGPETLGLAFVGVVMVGGETEAVIEQIQSGATSFVPVGGQAFGYRVAALDARSVTLTRDGREVRLTMGDHKSDAPRRRTLSEPVNLKELRGQEGQRLAIEVTGRLNGSVWGNGVYTDDSDLGTVAVHAGLLRPGQKGTVQVTLLPGQESYEGSTQNEVTSRPYASFPGSFRIGQ